MPVSRPRPMTYPRVTVRNDRFTQLSALATSTARPTATGRFGTFVAGTVIGYVSANAQQVVGFFYGSSKVSETKTDAMAAAFTQTFGGTTSTSAAD